MFQGGINIRCGCCPHPHALRALALSLDRERDRKGASPGVMRSKIDLLPKAIRAELDRRLGEGRFANSSALAEWLNDKGYEIGEIAVPHHGETLERRLDARKCATQHARAIAQAPPDDDAAINHPRL